MAVFILTFFLPRDSLEPFYSPTGESIDVISFLTNILCFFPSDSHRIISFWDLIFTFRTYLQLLKLRNIFLLKILYLVSEWNSCLDGLTPKWKISFSLLISLDDFCNFSFPNHCIFNKHSKHERKNTWKMLQPSLSYEFFPIKVLKQLLNQNKKRGKDLMPCVSLSIFFWAIFRFDVACSFRGIIFFDALDMDEQKCVWGKMKKC